jgi:hypothetical protein
VFGLHKPWWAYYYLHTAIPLCWCAAIGLALLFAMLKRSPARSSAHSADFPVGTRSADFPVCRTAGLPICQVGKPVQQVLVVAVSLFILCSAGWMCARVYLQVANLRQAPRIDSSPVIAQLQRFWPFTQWLYADKLVYSFHSGIPMVPSLAVVPIKRLWSGELDNAGIRRELIKFKPGLMLLLNDGRDVPFKDLLDAEYQMVYLDSDNRLYALRTIARKAMMQEN